MSVSERESTSNPSPEEASRFGGHPREVVLPNDWPVHDFLVDISNNVFSSLRPRFQIPDDMPLRKGHRGEICYTGGSSNLGFYKASFIVGLCLPLNSLHRQLEANMGVFICQIAPNAWRIFIGAKVLWAQLS